MGTVQENLAVMQITGWIAAIGAVIALIGGILYIISAPGKDWIGAGLGVLGAICAGSAMIMVIIASIVLAILDHYSNAIIYFWVATGVVALAGLVWYVRR